MAIQFPDQVFFMANYISHYVTLTLFTLLHNAYPCTYGNNHPKCKRKLYALKLLRCKIDKDICVVLAANRYKDNIYVYHMCVK